MKPMRYIILLNIVVNSSMYAGRDTGESSQRSGLKFPEARGVHRYLKNKEATGRRCILLEAELEFAKMLADSVNTENVRIKKRKLASKRLADSVNTETEEATKEVTRLLELLDKQVDEKAAAIRAAIDPSTLAALETLDLEALD